MRAAASHSTAARLLAPVAFLLAVTIAVLAVRAGLDAGQPAPANPGSTKPAAGAERFHVIVAGDTLGAVASRYGTTVEELGRINPGVQPGELRVGDRLRVR